MNNDKVIDLNNESYDKDSNKRIAPLKQLLQHSRLSEQMNDVITNQERDNIEASPRFNSCIEKQKQKKLARQREQQERAKEMAIEAARLRKERQSEMEAFDSFDSSRIVEKLFTENRDNDFPEYSLFDAVHYNFKNRKPRKLKAQTTQSTITGILPEAPREEREPSKSPLTTEKFRNQPFQIEKNINRKKEYSKAELAKYEPININIPFVKYPKEVERENITLTLSNEIHNDNDNVITNNRFSSSSSYSSESSSESLLSTLSQSTSSSSTSSIKKKIKSNNKRKINKKNVYKYKSSQKSLSPIKTVNEFKWKKINIDEENNQNKLKVPLNQIKYSCDMNVGTDNNADDKRFIEIMTTNNYLTETFKGNASESIDCHLNYQNKYKDNVLDHSLPLNILNIHSPDVSLSSFVKELQTQLLSLNDTVDILLKRMDVLEVNILDCSKYFVYR